MSQDRERSLELEDVDEAGAFECLDQCFERFVFAGQGDDVLFLVVIRPQFLGKNGVTERLRVMSKRQRDDVSERMIEGSSLMAG